MVDLQVPQNELRDLGDGEARTSTLAISGAKWVAAGSLSQKALQTLLVVFLARLLSPRDFGLIAVISLVLMLGGRLKQIGLHGALVQRKGDLEEAANAYFLLNGGMSLLIFAVVMVLSPAASWFFNDDRVALIMDVMAIKFLFEAGGAVQRSLTIRALDFRRQTLILLAESIITAIAAIILAASGFGVWALVLGMLLGAACATVLWWVTTPWRPTRVWSWSVTRQMLRFGIGLWSASNLSYIVESASRLLVGRFLGVLSLGYYEFTNRIVHGPTSAVIETSNRIALPAFCKEQEDRGQLGAWYIKMTGYVCLLTVPSVVVLLLLGDLLVPVIFGSQWISTVPLVRALAPFVFMAPLIFAWPVFVATGRPGLLNRFTVLRFLVTVPLLFLAARESLLAVCLAESLTASLLVPVNLYLVARLISIRFADILRALGQPLVGGGAFALVVLALRAVADGRLSGVPALSLAIYLVIGLTAYLATMRRMQPRLFADLHGLAAVALGRDRG